MAREMDTVKQKMKNLNALRNSSTYFSWSNLLVNVNEELAL